MRHVQQIVYTKWLWVLPAVGILLFVAIFPFVFSLSISFGKWPRFPGMPFEWVGGTNYLKALQDPTFLNSVAVTLKFIAWTLSLQVGLGFALALALLNLSKGRRIICSYLLIPSTLAPVVVGIIWLLIFSTNYGPLNFFLSRMGIEPVDWLGSPGTALTSVIIADIWEWTPFIMIILLSGLVSLPPDPFEAAKIDGASPLQTFFYITLPLLKPIILIAILLRIIDAVKIFGLVRVITKGGPGGATKVITYFIYNQAFKYWSLSYSAAITFFIMPVMILLVLIYFRAMRVSY